MSERAIDIHGEFVLAREAMQQKHWDALAHSGFDRPAAASIGGLGTARVAAIDDGCFEPSDAGVRAWIFPVWDGPMRDSQNPAYHPSELIDLVAWRPSEPDTFLMRAGLGWILGIDALERSMPRAMDDPKPLRLFRSPFAWALAGADLVGVVMVDWRQALPLLELIAIRADDVAHGQEIDTQLKWLRARIMQRIPEIQVPVDEPVVETRLDTKVG